MDKIITDEKLAEIFDPQRFMTRVLGELMGVNTLAAETDPSESGSLDGWHPLPEGYLDSLSASLDKVPSGFAPANPSLRSACMARLAGQLETGGHPCAELARWLAIDSVVSEMTASQSATFVGGLLQGMLAPSRPH